MIALEACGFAVRIESVHISWCSILLIISGPSIACIKAGRVSVTSDPSSAPPRNSSSPAIV